MYDRFNLKCHFVSHIKDIISIESFSPSAYIHVQTKTFNGVQNCYYRNNGLIGIHFIVNSYFITVFKHEKLQRKCRQSVLH